MQGFENVFVHEVGGHAIGHLADCYTRASTITSAKVQQTLQYQSLGWYLNVDVTGQKETCPWSFIFRAPEYNAYYSAVGLYEGARSHNKGIWRSESISCMNDNRFYYDAASRYAIVKQLKESAGETINWKDFVNKDYDRANANTGYACQTNRALQLLTATRTDHYRQIAIRIKCNPRASCAQEALSIIINAHEEFTDTTDTPILTPIRILSGQISIFTALKQLPESYSDNLP